MHRDLLRLRREDQVIAARRPGGVDGAVLGPGAFVIRFFGEEEDRLLLVNLEIELHLDPAPEPLLAPLDGCTWEVMWSSEDHAMADQERRASTPKRIGACQAAPPF